MAEEVKVEQTVEEQIEEKKVDVEALIAQLEKVNLTDPNKLKGKLQNAEGYKSVQAEKDRLANEVSSLRTEIENLKNSQVNKVNIDDFGDYQNNPIDLKETVRSVLREEKDAEQRVALERQKAQMAAYQKITGNKYWKEVGPAFEEKMKDPNINVQVQLGQLDPVELYNECTIEYFQDLSQKSLEALQLASGSKVKPPHVENSARTPTQNMDTRDDRQKKIDDIREKAKAPHGLHQEDQMELIKQSLGDFIKR